MDKRQLSFAWSEPGGKDDLDGLDEQDVYFCADGIAREARQVRQETLPELVRVRSGSENGEIRNLVGGGYLS